MILTPKLFLVFALAAIAGNAPLGGTSPDFEATPSDGCHTETSERLEVRSDAELLLIRHDPTSQFGITGTGTPDDPFLIDCLRFRGDGSNASVRLVGITLAVRLEQVEVMDAPVALINLDHVGVEMLEVTGCAGRGPGLFASGVAGTLRNVTLVDCGAFISQSTVVVDRMHASVSSFGEKLVDAVDIRRSEVEMRDSTIVANDTARVDRFPGVALRLYGERQGHVARLVGTSIHALDGAISSNLWQLEIDDSVISTHETGVYVSPPNIEGGGRLIVRDSTIDAGSTAIDVGFAYDPRPPTVLLTEGSQLSGIICVNLGTAEVRVTDSRCEYTQQALLSQTVPGALTVDQNTFIATLDEVAQPSVVVNRADRPVHLGSNYYGADTVGMDPMHVEGNVTFGPRLLEPTLGPAPVVIDRKESGALGLATLLVTLTILLACVRRLRP